MRVRFDHPAFVRGLPGRCRTERAVLARAEAEVEVREMSADELTVAASGSCLGRSFTIRMLDGALYARMAKDRDRFVAAIGSRLAIKAASRRRGDDMKRLAIWPEGADGDLRDISTGIEFGDHSHMSPSWNVTFTYGPEVHDIKAARADDIQEWAMLAAAEADEAVFCDGSFWMPIDDPVFIAPADGGAVKLHDRTFYLFNRGTKPTQPEPYGHSPVRLRDYEGYWNWSHVALPLFDFDNDSFRTTALQQQAWAVANQAVTVDVSEKPRIIDRLPYYEMERAARNLVAWMTQERKWQDLPSMERRVYELRNRTAADLVTDYERKGIWVEERLRDVLDRYAEWRREWGYNDRSPVMAAADVALRRWNEREIETGMAFAPAAAPRL